MSYIYYREKNFSKSCSGNFDNTWGFSFSAVVGYLDTAFQICFHESSGSFRRSLPRGLGFAESAYIVAHIFCSAVYISDSYRRKETDSLHDDKHAYTRAFNVCCRCGLAYDLA